MAEGSPGLMRRILNAQFPEPEQPSPIFVDGCPRCGHERGEPQDPPWPERLLRLRRLPARCQSWVPDEFTGWGGDCTCRHPFHGS